MIIRFYFFKILFLTIMRRRGNEFDEIAADGLEDHSFADLMT